GVFQMLFAGNTEQLPIRCCATTGVAASATPSTLSPRPHSEHERRIDPPLTIAQGDGRQLQSQVLCRDDKYTPACRNCHRTQISPSKKVTMLQKDQRD